MGYTPPSRYSLRYSDSLSAARYSSGVTCVTVCVVILFVNTWREVLLLRRLLPFPSRYCFSVLPPASSIESPRSGRGVTSPATALSTASFFWPQTKEAVDDAVSGEV